LIPSYISRHTLKVLGTRSTTLQDVPVSTPVVSLRPLGVLEGRIPATSSLTIAELPRREGFSSDDLVPQTSIAGAVLTAGEDVEVEGREEGDGEVDEDETVSERVPGLRIMSVYFVCADKRD
jgi:hypothetical protein